MANDVSLSTFPSNRTEALAMLYLNNQDLSNKTVEEITFLYMDTVLEVRESIKNYRANYQNKR